MSSTFLKRGARPRRSRQLGAWLGSLLVASYATPAASQEPELEVRVSSARRAERAPTGEGIDAQQARRVAGAGGDVVRGAESLAGVGRSNFGSGQWSLWGSDAASTLYYVDGISVPFLLYQGGLRSWVDADGVGQLILEPGAFEAAHGRTTAGNVLVLRRPPVEPGAHGQIRGDTLESGARASWRGQGASQLQVGARWGYAEWLNSVGTEAATDRFPVPQWLAYDVEAGLQLSPTRSVRVLLFGAGDELQRSVTTADPSEAQLQAEARGFTRLGVVYRETSADRSQLDALLYVGRDDQTTILTSRGKELGNASESVEVGARVSYATDVTRDVGLELGVDAAASYADWERSGSLTLPAREGDVSAFGQVPRGELARDGWRTQIVNLAPFGAAQLNFGALAVSVGVRLEHYVVSVDRQLPNVPRVAALGTVRMDRYLEPRASAVLRVTDAVRLDVAAGVHHQPPDGADLSPVFGAPSLGPSAGEHFSAGQRTRLTSRITMRNRLFYKHLADLAVRPSAEPALGQMLVQTGGGRSYGSTTSLDFQSERLRLSAQYTLSRSERRRSAEAHWRPFDEDRPHLVSLQLSHDVGAWRLDYRLRAASGAPETPVIGAYYDAGVDAYEPEFGAHNSRRIAAFWQLDVRVERTFPLGEELELSAFVDVQNITARANAERAVYSQSYRERGVLTGLPTLAILGLKLEL